jgi:predicted AAA+ superfamily ATPase
LDCIPNFSFSLSESKRSLRKLYCIDNGLAGALSYRFIDNRAHLFENFVFGELKKQGAGEVTFCRNENECDFVLKKGSELHAIQVCYELTPQNQARELAGFALLERDVKLTSKTVITYNQNQALDGVEVASAWRYFG